MSNDYGAVENTRVSIHEEVLPHHDTEEAEQEHAAISCGEEIKLIKWRMLIIICFLTFGGYWIYDFPGSLGTGPEHSIEALFISKGKEYNPQMNQILYSVYSIPNCVVATIGGILIDNVLGLRKSLLLFVTLVTLGSIVFWVGVTATSYPIVVAGRFLFGLGNESLSVAQNSFVARYFSKGWGIALAFGIVLSFSRVGSSFNFLFSPKIAESVNVQFSTLCGVFACCFSVGAAIVCILLDLYCERQGTVPLQKIKKAEKGKSTSFSFQDFKKIELRGWLIFIICITVYCSVFPFVGIGKNFFEVKYGVSQSEGATYVSYFQFACAGFSPFTGGFVDAIGRTVLWMMAAGGGFTLVHLLFILFSPTPTIMTIFMGVVYSILASSLWPAVPFIVAPSVLGLSYGIMNSLQNAGLAIYPSIVGAILNADLAPADPPFEGWCLNYSKTGFTNDSGYPPNSLENCSNATTGAPLPLLKGYEEAAWLFMVTAFIGVLVGIWLLIVDRARDGILFANAADRKEIFAKKLANWKVEEKADKADADARNAAYDKAQEDEENNNNNDASDKSPLLTGGEGINTTPHHSNAKLDS